MQLPSLLYTLLTLAPLAIASPTPHRPSLVARQSDPNCPDYCAGTQFSSINYVCGDPRLGPVYLPQQLPYSFGISDIVNPYDRLGGLCPSAFLAQWTNATTGSYNYPPQNGFQLNTAGQPIQGNMTLLVGMVLDRFGSEYGAFFSPIDAPYIQRALPPSNLDAPTSGPSVPYNYHVYNVTQEFVVLAGPIAPWFGQPGQGTQYNSYMNVLALIAGGFLSRVNVTDLLQ